MTDTNPRRSAGQLRRQLRIQRNRVVFPSVFGASFIALVVIALDSLSRFQVGVLLAFAVYAFGSAVMDAMLWREKRTRLAQLEHDRAQRGGTADDRDFEDN
jgi:hypothetical protein